MSVHIVTAKDLPQAMQRIRTQYGVEAVIVNVRQVRTPRCEMVEVLVAYSSQDASRP